MRRVLIVTSIGGFLPQFLMGDVRVLQELGYEVHYASNLKNRVYPFHRETLREDGIHLHQVNICKKPWHFIANGLALFRLIRIIRREDIQLVHCHNPVGGLLGRLAAWLSGRRPTVIYTAHGFHFFTGAPLIYRLLFYPAEWVLAGMTDVLITINHEDEERAQRLPVRGDRRFRIPGAGCSPVRFRPRPELRDSMRRELHVPESAFHLVSASEINDNKNLRVILDAMKLLGDQDVIYSICGRGPGRERLRDELRTLGLEDRVRFLGYRTDMERVLMSADCFVFPSRREGFGMAAVEALSCGIPVIASDNRGTREYMRDGENGFVCPAEDPAAFAEAIGRLKEDPELRARLSGEAVRSADAWTIDRTEDILRLVYGELAETGAK